LKKSFLVFCWFLALFPTLVFSQHRLILNEVINQSSDYIEKQLNRDAKIIIYPLNTAFGELTTFIANELTAKLINSHYLTILERNREILRTIENESNYQFSGEVSDETMVSIGKKLGAECITFFTIQRIGDRYIFNLRITDIEKGEIKGQKNFIFEPDPVLVNLISKSTTNTPKRTFNINDSNKIIISGYEIIETHTQKLLNQTAITIGEFRNICMDNRLLETHTALPNLFASIDTINLDDVIDYVISNRSDFPVQYILLYLSKTNIVTGNDKYNIPNRITASCDFVFIDFYSDQIMYGDTADTNGYLFELVDLNERTIVNESVKALKYLFSKDISINISDILNKL
jgi:hypothetical protein